MKRSRIRNGATRRGFTLVEMLVVLAILVLLMSMVGPRILGSKKKADISAAKTQIGMFMASLEGYAIDMNDFPDTEQGLQALIEEPVEAEAGTDQAASKWDGPYAKKSKIPVDPWGNEYQYEYPPTHSKADEPDIWSFGPDGEDDTEDDIVSWVKEEEGGGAEKGVLEEDT